MANKRGNIKQLVRNLREGKHAKETRIGRNVAAIAKREEGKKDVLQSQQNDSPGQQSNGEILSS
jgi:hypothetical protein